MKRVLLYLLAMAPLVAFAQGGQLKGTNYYRLQNADTKRYVSIVDTRVYRVGTTGVDLKAMRMLSADDFEDKVVCNPATICYIEQLSSSTCNLMGQGLNLSEYGYCLNVAVRPDNAYRLYGSTAGVSIYLVDNIRSSSPTTMQGGGDGGYRNWWFRPIDQSDEQYFGVKPDVTASADGSYWATMYAGFPFKPSATDTKVYTVCKVDYNKGFAVIKEVTGDVPTCSPVLFRCGAATPSGNKLTLLSPSTSADLGANILRGNYYCNDVVDTDEREHRHVVDYNKNMMRMLGTTADGKPAFVKSDIKYLPANKCYLLVGSSAPDVLQIVTEEEYATGINELEAPATEEPQVIYDLQGRRIATPSKGLYIVNGKKMVIK